MGKKLREQRDHLEKLIQERTSEVVEKNRQLEKEIARRNRLEDSLRRSLSECRSRNESLNAINSIEGELYRSLNLEEVVEKAVEALVYYTKSPMVAFYFLNRESNELELLRSRNFTNEVNQLGSVLPLENSLSGITSTNKEVVSSEDMARDDRLYSGLKEALLKQDGRSAVSVPLLFRDSVLGVVNVIFREKCTFKDAERKTLLSIGKTIGLTMANARHVERIEAEVVERKRAEEMLERANEDLQARVQKRTIDLKKSKEQLEQEAEEVKRILESLKARETELESQSRQLEEMHSALKVLSNQRDKDKKEIEENMISNVKDLISPYIDKLKNSANNDQRVLLEILEENLNNIASPFIKVSSRNWKLTPAEIRIVNLIKRGKTTKEIAEMSCLSGNTILFHRHNIRTKLGLKQKGVNLVSYLRSFEE